MQVTKEMCILCSCPKAGHKPVKCNLPDLSYFIPSFQLATKGPDMWMQERRTVDGFWLLTCPQTVSSHPCCEHILVVMALHNHMTLPQPAHITLFT